MGKNATRILILLAALAVAAGCSDGHRRSDPLDAGDDVSAAEMAAVALDADLTSEETFGSEVDGLDASVSASSTDDTVTREVTFSRTRPCPGGGTCEIEGHVRATFRHRTRVMEAEGTGTRTRTDCVYAGERHTYTVNGTARWEKTRRRVAGVPDGPQTSRYHGSFNVVRSDGAERFCEYDVTIVRDPGSRTRTLDGTICGTSVSRTVTWNRQD